MCRSDTTHSLTHFNAENGTQQNYEIKTMTDEALATCNVVATHFSTIDALNCTVVNLWQL